MTAINSINENNFSDSFLCQNYWYEVYENNFPLLRFDAREPRKWQTLEGVKDFVNKAKQLKFINGNIQIIRKTYNIMGN